MKHPTQRIALLVGVMVVIALSFLLFRSLSEQSEAATASASAPHNDQEVADALDNNKVSNGRFSISEVAQQSEPDTEALTAIGEAGAPPAPDDGTHEVSLQYFLDADHYLESKHHNPHELNLAPADTKELNKLIGKLNDEFTMGRMMYARQTQAIGRAKLKNGEYREILPGEGSSHVPNGAERIHSVLQGGIQAEVLIFPEQEPELSMLLDQEKLLIENGIDTIQQFIETHGTESK